MDISKWIKLKSIENNIIDWVISTEDENLFIDESCPGCFYKKYKVPTW